jgi:hypothetical protein
MAPLEAHVLNVGSIETLRLYKLLQVAQMLPLTEIYFNGEEEMMGIKLEILAPPLSFPLQMYRVMEILLHLIRATMIGAIL